jgi:hypothetical protein
LKSGKTSPLLNINAVSPIKWKTYDNKPIPFPIGEDPAHVRLVCKSCTERLAYLKGCFSKKASSMLPSPDPKREDALELHKPLEGQPPSFCIFLSLLSLEKETINKQLYIGFIKLLMAINTAFILFILQPYTKQRRFYIDYW